MVNLMWRCLACGYIHDGDSPPERCPNCGAPKERFERLPEDKAQLIERSRRTNQLHLKLMVLVDEVKGVGEEGVEDNLDPRCSEIFRQAIEMAEMIKRRSRAEIQSHIGKGKWG